MTNNPTIDGVSRELLQHAFNAVNYLSLRADEIGSSNVPIAEALRALLDADHTGDSDAMVSPAVERQEPVAWRGVNSLGEIVTEWIDGSPPEKLYDLCGNEAMYDKVELAYLHPSSGGEGWHEDSCGNLKYWPEEAAALQSTIAQLRIDLGNQTVLTKQADYHASQRGNEIAQLQARITQLESEAMYAAAGYQAARDRIAELESDQFEGWSIDTTTGRPILVFEGCSVIEDVRAYQIIRMLKAIAELDSGRGEPVAWLTNGGQLFYFASSNIEPLPTDQPLYAAPPAPVAVVLPERKPEYDAKEHPAYQRGWNACLDATAALNKTKGADWHDVAGDDEGLAK